MQWISCKGQINVIECDEEQDIGRNKFLPRRAQQWTMGTTAVKRKDFRDKR
jgi:hypothetical protein